MQTPDGFVITTQACERFLEEAGLRSWIQSEQADLHDLVDIRRTSASLREAILTQRFPILSRPPSLQATCVTARLGFPVRVAVRSSALGEDGELSFAGQFLTLLNVSGDHLVEAYLRIIASLYSAEAISYRRLHHIPGESAEMAVGIIAMVEARCSGIVFSRDPANREPGQTIIQAVRGLGSAWSRVRFRPKISEFIRAPILPWFCAVLPIRNSASFPKLIPVLWKSC